VIGLRLQMPFVFGARPELKFDPKYQRYLTELAESMNDNRRLTRVGKVDLDEEAKVHLRLDALAATGIEIDRKLFAETYAQTRQLLLAPEVIEKTPAICTAWKQPPARQLWEAWDIAPRRDIDLPSYEAARAVLTTTSAFGDIYLNAGRDRLANSPLVLETFTDLARSTSRGASLPLGNLPIRGYESVTKVIKSVTTPDTPLLMQAMNVDIVRELAGLFPDLPIGRWVSADAQMVAAWAAQVSGKVNGELNPEREAFLRRRCDQAGYRVYGYDRDGIGDPDKRPGIARPKSVRGYLLLVLTDITTGIPLVGIMVDASKLDEPIGLRPLLLRLYGMWPDIPLQGVIGDKAYDEHDACLTCELDFGLAPVFIRQPSHAELGGVIFKREENPTIARIDGWGVAWCRQHELPMRMETLERPDRTDLAPGDRADAAKLRYRFACTAPEPCGRASVKVDLTRPDGRQTALASALVRLPHHHRSQRPRELALRHALQAARNSASEAAFSSLQMGFGIGGRDSKRPRIYELDTLETMAWLAFGTRALLMLHAHRTQHKAVLAHLETIKRPRRSHWPTQSATGGHQRAA